MSEPKPIFENQFDKTLRYRKVEDGTPESFVGYDEQGNQCNWSPPTTPADTEASETRGVSQTFSSIVDATLTERGKNYGDFTDNADYAQRIKQAFYESKAWHNMPTYMQEALDLIASKIGRMLSGDPFYLDNWHDIGGYTTLVEQRIKQRSKR
jgi:hypothetical protein